MRLSARTLLGAVLTALLVLSGFVPAQAYTPASEIAPSSLSLIKGEALTPVQFITDGDPAIWSLDLQTGEALPVGLSFDASTGQLSGTPTAAGGTPFVFTVKVTSTDPANTAVSSAVSQTLQGSILERPNTFSHANLGSFYTNLTMYEVISAQGFPAPALSLSAGQIPNGMSFNASTGELVGTPISTGNYSFTITATNSAGALSQTFSGVITNGKPGQIYPGTTGPYVAGSSVVVRFTTDGNPVGALTLLSGSTPTGTTYSNGVLSGTATTPGTYSFTLRSTNQFGTKEVAYSVVVSPKVPTAVYPLTLGSLYTTSATSKTFTGNGIPAGTFSVAAGNLPSGLSLNSATGALTGTVAATLPASYSFTIRVTNTQGFAEREYSGSLTDGSTTSISPSAMPNLTAGSAVSVQLQSDGLPTVVFTNTAGTIPAGLSLSSEGLISGTPTGSGAYDFTIRATNVVSGTTHTLDRQYTGVISALPPSAFTPQVLPDIYLTSAVAVTIETNGVPVPTLSLDLQAGEALPEGVTFALGSGADLGRAFLAGTPTQVGAYAFTVKAVIGETTITKTYSGTVQSGQITAITPATIPDIQGGRPFSLTLVGDSYPAPTFSLLSTNTDTSASALPQGLTLASSGVISGTPTSAGTFRFTVRGTSGTSPNAHTVDKTYSVVVVDSAPTNITPGTLPSMTAGVVTTPVTFLAEGLPAVAWSVSAGALPAGLTLDTSTGTVSGTPTAGGLAYSFTIKATNSIGFAERLLTGHVKSTTCPTNLCIINNNRLKFGNGASGAGAFENSINGSGLLQQPFYYNGAAWQKLTYSSYPLDMAVAAGSTSTYPRASVTELSGQNMTGQTINYSDFIITSQTATASFGYGKIIVSGNFNISDGSGTKVIKVTHIYELGANDNFVKMTTSVQNISSTEISNLTVFVGTRDDFVGGSDAPTKTKGNIVDGAFVAITNQATPASVLRITSGSEGVLFYSTNDGVNMSADRCCSFSNAYNVNPTSSPITLGPADGSYAAHFPFGNIAANDTSTLTWFYAAGATAELASVTRNVASAAAPVAPTVTRGNGQALVEWQAPASADPIVSYTIRYSSDNGVTWTNIVRSPASIATNQLITGLQNGSIYLFQIAAITQPSGGGNTVTGAWSNSSSPAYIGYPDAPTISGGTAGNSTLTVNLTPGASAASPITAFDYSLDDGATWFTVSPEEPSATSITVNELPNGGTYTVRVRARNQFGPGTASSSVVLYTNPIWTDRALKSMAKGKTYSDGVTASANITSYEVVTGTLPSGLTLNGTTGAITGTPTAVGNYSFRIRANNPNANIEQLFTGTVTDFFFAPGVFTFDLITATAANIQILGSDSEGLDLTTGATFSLNTALPSGLSFSTLNASTSGIAPTYRITGTATVTGNFERTLTITDSQGRTASAAITLRITVGNPGAPAITGITGGDGQLAVAFTAGGAGTTATTKYQYTLNGGTTWIDFPVGALTSPLTITGLSNGANHTVSIRAVNSVGPSAGASSITNRTQPIWVDEVLGTFSQGIVYSDSLSATSGISGYSVSAGSLPQGISLDPVSGLLSGTPTLIGNYAFTLRVTNSAGFIEKQFSGRVSDRFFSPINPNLVVTVGATFAATIQTSDSDGLVLTNGLAVVVSGLPAGIIASVADENTANTFASISFSGIPTQPGSYPIVITVTDSAGRSYTATVNLVVSNPPSATNRILPKIQPKLEEGGKKSGELSTLQGEKLAESSTTVMADQSKLEVKAGDWKVTVQTIDDKGIASGIAPTGTVEVTKGAIFSVEGQGFVPDTKVWVYVMSTPILLGEFEISSLGEFTEDLFLPLGLELGEHTLQILGYTKDEQAQAVSLGFTLFEAKPAAKKIRVYFAPNKATLLSSSKAALKKFLAAIPAGQALTSVSVVGAATKWNPQIASKVAANRLAFGLKSLKAFEIETKKTKTQLRSIKLGSRGRYVEIQLSF